LEIEILLYTNKRHIIISKLTIMLQGNHGFMDGISHMKINTLNGISSIPDIQEIRDSNITIFHSLKLKLINYLTNKPI
jgi:hypothetical protein